MRRRRQELDPGGPHAPVSSEQSFGKSKQQIANSAMRLAEAAIEAAAMSGLQAGERIASLFSNNSI